MESEEEENAATIETLNGAERIKHDLKVKKARPRTDIGGI